MPFSFKARLPSFDARKIDDTIRRALASAGLDTTSGPLRQVTETIRRALGSDDDSRQKKPAAANDSVIDVVARVAEVRETDIDRPAARQPAAPGSFETCSFSNRAGTLSYKLYQPAQRAEAQPPIVVMLHGCTQSANDFAAGTRMNELADRHGFLVVYPEQTAQANPSKCWNWFKQEDQVRDAGEPSLIAGIAREVAARHGADPGRIFVAGLSAGAAMAVVLGEAYPEVFAGVGAHSGLPYGSAHDIPSALAAMKGGRSGLPGLMNLPGLGMGEGKAVESVPIIVFHGDRDHTVQHENGVEIVKQASDAWHARSGNQDLTAVTETGKSTGGRAFTRTVQADDSGNVRIESWTVHGAGHAWSGGDASGSYTDKSGPDASAEMVRFFLSLPRAGSA